LPVARTVYLGTSPFAVDVLEALAEAGERPQLVVTPPDRRAGRGRREAAPPAALAARRLGIELHQTADVNDEASLEAIRRARPELALVCAFGQIIREPLLSELDMLNVHPSLLPRWRGAAPIERAIMAGDELTGVCIARVTAGLDSGPVALVRETRIEPGEAYGSLASRLASVGGELALRALRERQGLEFREQDEAGATYAEKIAPGERRLDPAQSAVELERTVRALTPHAGAYLGLADGARLGVVEARAVEGDLETGKLEAAEDVLRLGTSAGVLAIGRLKPAGGREMDAAAYLRGHRPPTLAPPG
jgi:methionyl-tRNA formyltransferase